MRQSNELSRTTVHGIYGQARKTCRVFGQRKVLWIEGGEYQPVTAEGTAVVEAAVGVIDAAEVLQKSQKLKTI